MDAMIGSVIGGIRLSVVCILLVSVGIVSCQMSVSVDISVEEAMPGDNLTMVCRLTGGSVSTQVYIFKEVLTDDAQSIKEVIAIAGILTPLYQELGRYTVRSTDDGSAILHTLDIKGVSIDDSGHLGCYLPEQTDAYDSERLEVFKQASSIYFTNYTDGSTITLEEGEEIHIECIAEDVVPIPQLRIRSEQKDFTDKFIKLTHTELDCDGSHGQKEQCSLHFHYNTVLNGHNLVPADLQETRTLTCESALPSHHSTGLEPIRTTIHVNYRFSPVFDCEDTVSTPAHTTNYTISCLVRYNPEAWMFEWRFRVDGMDYTLHPATQYQSPGQQYNLEGYTAIVQPVDDQSSRILLTISEVYEMHFTDYHLMAYQLINNNTHTITLNREIVTPPPSSASSIFMTSSVIVFTFMTYFLYL